MTRTTFFSLLFASLVACGDSSESDGDGAPGSTAGQGGAGQVGSGAAGSSGATGGSSGSAAGGAPAGQGGAGAAGAAGVAGAPAGQGGAGSGQGGASAGQGGAGQAGAGVGGAGSAGAAGAAGAGAAGAGAASGAGQAGTGGAGAGGGCAAPVPCPKFEPVDGEPCDPCTAEVCGYDRCDKPTPSNSAAECLPSGIWKVSAQSCAVVKCGATSCPAGLVCLKYDVAGPGTEAGCAKDPCYPEPLGCGCAGPIFCEGLQCIENGQSTIVCSDKQPN